MFSVNHKLRFRIDLSRCASGVRFLRAPWLVWWSILYSFHINGLLDIRHKYSTYSFNTKTISCDSRWFIPKRSLFLTDRTFFNERICSLLLSLLVSYRTHRREKTFWEVVISQSLLKPDMKAKEMPYATDSISTRNCYLIIEGWAFVAIAGFSHAFKLLLWRLPKILAPLRARNEMSYDYGKVTKAEEPRSFLIRSLWGSRAISIHPLTNTPCTKEEKYGLPAEINASKTTKQNP